MVSERLNSFLFNNKSKEQLLQLVNRRKDASNSEEPILFYGSSSNMDAVCSFLEDELGEQIKICEGERLINGGTLTYILTSLKPHDVLLVKNIEIQNSYVEEYLVEAVKKGSIDIMIDNGPNARSISIDINPFNLIGTLKTPQQLSDNLKLIFYNNLCVDNSVQEEDCVIEASNHTLNVELELPFQNLSSEIKVPAGLSDTCIQEFTFDTVGHPHAFILGQSGSGKSVLLHSIITSMILKYTPEDLQLYLLDFKMGGVEFNRYKSVKHIKALLVDNSDIQITLEILKNIESQMKERGKLLRESGVSNIADYNKIHSSNRMPSIVIAVDECHVLFSNQVSHNHSIQTEISNIVSTISKEGRSQGVHLLFATQTLAGAEINVDVMNNITDHYLLKCSPSDSERMVSGSSPVTSNQSVGLVYYHHVEKQCQFKSFYHSNDELAEIIEKSISRALSNNSNGQFYFSGSQIFDMNNSVRDLVATKGRKNIVASIGKAISLDESPISIVLKREYSENILLFGINDQEQVTRATMNLLLTLSISNVQKKLGYKFIVFDCLNSDEGKYTEILDEMEANSLCSIVAGKQRGTVLKQLVDEISNEVVQPTILVILGQERFRELKLDTNLPIEEDLPTGGGLLSGLDFSTPNNASVRTYKDALRFILERGPEIGVHTILQVDKPDKLLFSEYTVSAKDVFSIFKHLIMLRSDENSATRFIDNQIKLETLSGDNDRLRAYYYSDDEDKYTLFTPYSMPTLETLSLIK